MLNRISDFRLKGSNYPYHVHDQESQFMAVVDGTACQIINGHEIRTSCGDIYIIQKGCTHEILDAKDLHIFNIDFNSESLFQRIGNLQNTPEYAMLFEGDPHLSTPDQRVGFMRLSSTSMRDVLAQLQQINQEYLSNLIGRQTVLDADFLLLIVSICRQYEKPPTQSGLDDRLQQTLDFISANYASPFSLRELAAQASLSERQFLRVFKNAYGLTPTEYIGKLRIERARDILLETDCPITTIAMECGFSDSSYFAKYFKKLVGCSPTEYRKHILNV